MPLKKNIYGEEHFSVANSYFDLGNIYCSVKQYPVSEECYEKALNIYKTLYGEQHAFVKRTFNELEFVKRKQRELKIKLVTNVALCKNSTNTLGTLVAIPPELIIIPHFGIFASHSFVYRLCFLKTKYLSDLKAPYSNKRSPTP